MVKTPPISLLATTSTRLVFRRINLEPPEDLWKWAEYLEKAIKNKISKMGHKQSQGNSR